MMAGKIAKQSFIVNESLALPILCRRVRCKYLRPQFPALRSSHPNTGRVNLVVMTKRTRKRAVCVTLAIGAGALGFYGRAHLSGLPISFDKPSTPAQLSRWPWQKLQFENLSRGVRHWQSTQNDGTNCDLLEFDFGVNPSLKFAIAEQDADDNNPFDNVVSYWPRGAAQMTQQLNARFATEKKGRVVALWNGLFFGYYEGHSKIGGTGFHVSPVVLNGKTHFTQHNHRWFFGCKYLQGKPQFKVVHLPTQQQLSQFDWGGGAVQCLILDGKPLKLAPFPRSSTDFQSQPVASTPDDVGHVPYFDHMKTSRMSLAWSRDSRKLWLLAVKEPDWEAGSSYALQYKLPLGGGWTVADVQRFWLSRGADGAINSDAGDVAQLAYRRGKNYQLIPPRWASNQMRIDVKSDFSNAPHGGAVTYFTLRDAGL